jgi:hypothetical protein
MKHHKQSCSLALSVDAVNNSAKGKFVGWLSTIPYTLTKIIDDFTEPKEGIPRP